MGAAMFKDTKSAVSLAGMYEAGKGCWLPWAGEAGFLPISAGKASNNNNNTQLVMRRMSGCW